MTTKEKFLNIKTKWFEATAQGMGGMTLLLVVGVIGFLVYRDVLAVKDTSGYATKAELLQAISGVTTAVNNVADANNVTLRYFQENIRPEITGIKSEQSKLTTEQASQKSLLNKIDKKQDSTNAIVRSILVNTKPSVTKGKTIFVPNLK